MKNGFENILKMFKGKSILIILLGILLLVFSVVSVVSNKLSQNKIQDIENIHVALPFQMSRLFNEIGLASAAQNNYFTTGDTTFDKTRKDIWSIRIKSISESLIKMKETLPNEDKLLIEKAISGLGDYEIAQDEMNLLWQESKLSTNPQQKKEAQNTLNERRLTLTSLTQDDAAAILIPLQNKYQEKAKTEMQSISSSTYKSNWTILLSAFFAVILISLLLLRQRDLIKARKMAEVASVAKSEFLASMSHEIRTPLNGVIGFTDLLMQSKLTDTQQQYMSTVSQSANSLLDIINDILDFSKIEAGKLELSIEKTDILEIGSQVADMIKYQAHKKNLEILLNISTQIPRYIWADEIRLRQVMINLLSNAVKFTEFGEIELKIEVLSKNEKGESIFRFSVRDTGIGIDARNTQKVFDAFSQEDGSTTKRFGGTGLGLTISNKLLALMGSKLQLESELGKGSTFYFDVPFKTMYGEHLEWDNLDNIQTILIVDDNTNNRIILRDMLALKDIASDEAKSGLEALEKIKSNKKYDVVLMDYHMPYMDGIETIRKIRALFSSPEEQPIMLLYSSSDDAFIINACEELQVQQRLIKPLKINQLYNSLSLVKGNRQLKNANKSIETVNLEGESSYAKTKILIAEDNSINMLLARTMIKNILPDVTILEALTGKQALDIYIESKPDFIFMDIQMPELNGYDTAIAIRKVETGTRIPIIALTAGTVLGEKEKCLAAGMDDYVSKPFVKSTIEDIIKIWFKK
jgi:signal transduction histidine kinase/CheY-like chemotaxis protein